VEGVIKNLPQGRFERSGRSDLLVGCVASFFPMAQKIPVNMAAHHGPGQGGFTSWGGEEWCCASPSSEPACPKDQALMEHNMQKVKRWVPRKWFSPALPATTRGSTSTAARCRLFHSEPDANR